MPGNEESAVGERGDGGIELTRVCDRVDLEFGRDCLGSGTQRTKSEDGHHCPSWEWAGTMHGRAACVLSGGR
jgi:hypothetical protein